MDLFKSSNSSQASILLETELSKIEKVLAALKTKINGALKQVQQEWGLMGASRIIIIMAIVIISGAVYSPVSAKEIIIGNDSEADFGSIQEAVNSSSSGDVILVLPGFYNESVSVKVDNLSILSNSENPEDTTVRAFNLRGNNTTVSGFSIQETLTLKGIGGHDLDPVGNCTIKNNVLKLGISANGHNSIIEKNVILNSGIFVYSFYEGSNFIVSDNLIFEGRIRVYHGPLNCTLLNNTLLNGSISVGESPGCKILGNYISNNQKSSGISLWESSSNEIENNTVVNCSSGISTEYLSSQNTVNNNTLICNDKGIWIKGSGGGNSLLNNTISNNNIGIWIEADSSSNLVANNKVELNKKYGVCLNGVAYTLPFNRTNRFYNNIFNNTINLFNETNNHYTTEANNIVGIFPVAWNTTEIPGTNIVGGPRIGGNYWAKPDGTGFSQICADSEKDGIGDLPYNITDNDTDYFPLVSASRSKETIIPIANFSTNITHTLVPLTVQFTDLSRNTVSWSWDFDNNGIPDSTSQNPVHTYTSLGTYIVNLTASNGKEISSKTLEIEVQEAKVPPIADFSTNVTDGQVPFSVKFTDLSKNATAVVWDFNSDGIPDSTERTPVYVYTYPGNYTVHLTVNNTKGTDSKSSTVTVSPAQRLEGKLVITEYQITTSESYETQPAIYEDRIVWESNHDENYTLHLYNISTFSEVPIISINYFSPDICNDRVVRRESGNIYLYNLSTSTKTLISNQLGIYPAIYGDKIVWQGECSGDCIYMYDISSSKQIRVTDNRSISSLPAIYGDRIVWESRTNDSGSSNIFMYDISTSRKTQITTNESNQRNPDIYGDRIVWEDHRNGNLDIYMYDLSTAKEMQITTSGSAHDPAIYGDRIVWQDDRNDKEYTENSDIYMYDLSTKKETQITTNESRQQNPAIYGDKIVWIDYRNGFGNPDVYMCTISEQAEK